MKKKDSDKSHDHVKRELRKEREISIFLIVAIIILLALGVLLAVFSDDEALIAVWIRNLFSK